MQNIKLLRTDIWTLQKHKLAKPETWTKEEYTRFRMQSINFTGGWTLQNIPQTPDIKPDNMTELDKYPGPYSVSRFNIIACHHFDDVKL